MEQELQKLKKDFFAALKGVASKNDVESLRTRFLGRKGVVTAALRKVKAVAVADRPKLGKLANALKREVEEALASAHSNDIGAAPIAFDTTLPGVRLRAGHLHPITLIQRQLEEICREMGFAVLDGPEVESEYFNFEALNIGPDHPARDAQDTFWLKNGNLLRTHTSPVQIRALQKHGAPFRCIVPGRVFRYEATDASHDHTFYQMEGLMVDEKISVANLIAVARAFLTRVMNAPVDIRLRPAYYPFVEPGFDIDFKCLICSGAGCPVCKRVGWIEMMGAGMVHPKVLSAGNVDPARYTGFAFGLGTTRLAMMKYGVDDIRHFFSGDLRFINQF